jgi:hypothetical protein
MIQTDFFREIDRQGRGRVDWVTNLAIRPCITQEFDAMGYSPRAHQ